MSVNQSKALVILKVDKEHFSKNESQSIRKEDCEVIHVEVLNKSNYKIVLKILKKVFQQTGNPIGIISNQGGDLVKGIKRYNKFLVKKMNLF